MHRLPLTEINPDSKSAAAALAGNPINTGCACYAFPRPDVENIIS